MMISINHDRIVNLADLFSRAVRSMQIDDFTDTDYYPPRDADRETVTMYFLVMVAMDHRLSRPGKPYEAVIDGKVYHGADLLYKLGSLKLRRDPEFFTAERLASINRDELLKWLSIGKVKPPDIDVRVKLLRDIGVKLLKLYNGSAYAIVEESRGYLRRGVGEGLIDLLKVFSAYQDPVEKKAFLLAKFLERRMVVRFNDPYNKEVPVDNHLVRIALRLGMVSVDGNTIERIRLKIDFDWREDVALRLAVRQAYKLLAAYSGLDPFILDDFLWLFGRRCCLTENPVCKVGCNDRCSAIGGCLETCIFKDRCLAYGNSKYMIPEHRFLRTWWY